VVNIAAYDAAGDDADAPWQYSAATSSFKPGVETYSMDGKRVSEKYLGGIAEGEQFNAGAYIQPAGLQLEVYADHVTTLSYFPVSIDRTQLVSQWYVHENAVEGIDYHVERVIEMGDLVNRQDVALCELVQPGITSRRYVPGPLSINREHGLRSALKTYLSMMEQA
jgi:Rieske 2Fe-2S family protein